MGLLGALLAGFAVWLPVSGPSPCPEVGAQRGAEVEPSVAASLDGHVAVAAWQQDRFVRRAAAGIGVTVSRDGGPWTPVVVPGVSGCFTASDPWVSVGAGDVMWVSSLRVFRSRHGFVTRVALASSRDSGVTWSPPAFLSAPGDGFNDKPSVVADPIRPRAAYVVWTLDSVPYFSSTFDGGRRWSPPRRIGHRATLASTLTLFASGALLHTYLAYGGRRFRIEASRSFDGGRSWSPPVRVARLHRSLRPPPGPSIRALPFSGTGAVAARGGELIEAFLRDNGVAISRSRDGGHTWSSPQVVVRSRLGMFAPSLAAGPGGVALGYYERAAGGRATFDLLRLGGRPVRIAGPFPLAGAPRSQGGVFLGDYSGLAATSRGYLAAFAAPPPLARDGRSDILVSLR